MTDSNETKMLVEEATTAWRPRTPDGTILEHPAWGDLEADGRQAVFDETLVARRIERAMDSRGLSTTVRAVLSRLSKVD